MPEFNPGTGRRGVLEQPGVRVFQVFDDLAPTIIRPLLEAVIIGENYQIETQTLAGLYTGALKVFSYPGILAGATVLPGETEVFLQTVDDLFDITTSAGVVITPTSVTVPASLIPSLVLIDHKQKSGIIAGNIFEDQTASFVADNIRPGDKLTFETVALDLENIDSVVSTLNTVTFTVLEVCSDTKLKLSPSLTQESGKFEYTITRYGASSGEVLITYRALRSDTVGTFYEVESLVDLEEQLGPAVPLNPLSYAMSLALQNTVNLVAGTAVLDQDSVTDHQEATEFLESYEVYAMVPLTQNESVFQVYEQHVNQMSDPHEKRERVVFINPEIEDFTVYQTSSVTGSTDATDGSLFQDVNAQFITNQVPVGAVIKLAVAIAFPFPGGPLTDELQILQVNSETEVKLIDDAALSLSGLTYTVQSAAYTKLQKARNVRDLGEAFNNRRVILIEPDEAEFPVGDSTEFLPGYYLGAIYAGLISGTSPSQGFTNLPVAGAVGLRNSNRFFSETQLGTMAAGGVFIAIQEAEQGPITSRHQLTTAVSTIETRELSIVKAIDYSAKFFRNTLKPLIGIFNITPDFINSQVRPAVAGVIQDLKEEQVIGVGTIITAIEQDKNFPDNLNVFIRFEVLYPCNFINVILVI